MLTQMQTHMLAQLVTQAALTTEVGKDSPGRNGGRDGAKVREYTEQLLRRSCEALEAVHEYSQKGELKHGTKLKDMVAVLKSGFVGRCLPSMDAGLMSPVCAEVLSLGQTSLLQVSDARYQSRPRQS